MRLWPDRQAVHLAIRMLVATAVADAATHALGLHSGYWAMITTVLVVQGNLGVTLQAGFWRLVGTVLGGVLGMAGVLARAHHLLPEDAVLALVLAPLVLAAAINPQLRVGPVTALIVLLVTPMAGAGPEAGIALALGRIGEIAIGSVIGIAVSALVLPRRAAAAFRDQTAETLRALGDLAHGLLAGEVVPDAARMRRAMAAAEQAHDALRREQVARLAGPTAAGPVLDSLRALRVDIAMLRHVVVPGQPGRAAAFAEPIRARCLAAAEALAAGRAPAAMQIPDLAAVPEPQHFCLRVLLGELTLLERNLAVYAGATAVETAPVSPHMPPAASGTRGGTKADPGDGP